MTKPPETLDSEASAPDDNGAAIITVDTPANALTLGVLHVNTPDHALVVAAQMATPLAALIDKQRLYTQIGKKKHVHVEGWTTMGGMMGIIPREVSCHWDAELESYVAYVELVRVSDGAIIGGASSSCGMDESTWAARSKYAMRSMAVTRATGKAFRLGFSWVMVLAGYSPTPAEEMPPEDDDRPAAPRWSKNPAIVKRAYDKAHALGLTDDEIAVITGVEHLSEFEESAQAYNMAIEAYASGKQAGAYRNAENIAIVSQYPDRDDYQGDE